MPPRMLERNETSEGVSCKSVRETTFRPAPPTPPRMLEVPAHAAPDV
jgi:hypothetical protein